MVAADEVTSALKNARRQDRDDRRGGQRPRSTSSASWFSRSGRHAVEDELEAEEHEPEPEHGLAEVLARAGPAGHEGDDEADARPGAAT